MSSSILERARSMHEHAEQYEQAVVAILDDKPTGQKAKTWQQHSVKNVVSAMANSYSELLNIYEDKDSLMHSELEAMKGANMFSSFYETLKNVSEYNIKFPDVTNSNHVDLERIAHVTVQFSGEEVFGKYLDLNSFYDIFCNLPNMNSKDLDYLQYLNKFNSFFFIPETTKSSKVYFNYVTNLWNYLADFFWRIQPLVDVQEYVDKWKEEFQIKWKNGQIQGWVSRGVKSGGEKQPLRLGVFNSPQELEVLGLERLKEGLEALGLKCGGTLKDRAERLWSVRGVKPSEIPEKLKAKKSSDESSTLTLSSGEAKRQETAFTEFKIQCLCELIADIVTATRRHAEKQQTRTLEEKLAEILEEERGTLPDVEEHQDDDDDDNEGPLYNPLNLPLGWDGKPIPFWLYKLHGLGVEYKCEICGNQSYWGRRAFDRHFQEWRHAHGMRCLGVPNTKHFHDICLIEDALALYAKIKGSMKVEQFVSELEEEFEDSEGNVLNRRTYEDLARQGLL